ncbi:ABC transporter permease [Streptomyces sp. PSKA54]|uniref:ABC transporter permease n=1 Tax=Streptomyces himalayensis subsp. aureolus TaxID=2758039 RepID=A0A7W2CXY0_9ACTN|nr:ABC transporter permease [Streptomyces himalayensis]MBA4861143.1 ABC transporter permease [Streptomyces himalayensis subsp. aureolus]
MRVRQWSRDLAMGAGFAFTSGREGWVRVLLTAVGVGLGVAGLLLTTAIPNALAVRHERANARTYVMYSQERIPKADNTVLVANVDTAYRGRDVRGRALEAEGTRAPLPPGLKEFPAADEMVVSPALKKLLASDDGKLLRKRLPQHIGGTIGESGLIGSAELAFYRGGEGLAKIGGSNVTRIDEFGLPNQSEPLDPVLLLLVLVVFVVLLMPVGVFIAAAVRFGGERRDRRLAALRLIGSDTRMTRRIAAGEALGSSLLGLALGTVLFLIGRQVVGSVEVYRISVFPGYLDPTPALAALIAVAVPAAAVGVTLFALRGVVIEPLGVVRTARPPRRRLWWRLLLPLGGLAMLYPMIGMGTDNGDFNQYLVIGGVILLLVGVTALLPWIVETVVARLSSGGVAWQLAVRRLQLGSGTAARMVNGIAVAVAGAIALQMLFSGVQGNYTKESQNDLSRARIQVSVPNSVPLGTASAKFTATKGVEQVQTFSEGYLGDRRKEPDLVTQVTIGDCAFLREVASLPSCHNGDVFAMRGGEYDIDTPKPAEPGRTLYFDPSYGSKKGEAVAWSVPRGMKEAQSVKDPSGMTRGGFLMTPSALPAQAVPALSGRMYLKLDESVPDVREFVRNTAVKIDPLADTLMWTAPEQNRRFSSIRTGLFVGATCVLILIGASLLVSQLEQLRERKKLLSALVAFGTRRRTLSLSVLWQTAIPVALGLALATVVGLALGTTLMKMTDVPVTVDWTSVLSMTVIGAAVILLVTALSLPPLWRMMRPEGLRTE